MPNDKSLLTAHNIVFTGSTIGFVAPKAVAAYRGQSVSLNTTDWVTGGSIPVLFHLLSQCHERNVLDLPWYFDEHFPSLVCERLRRLKRRFCTRSHNRYRTADPDNHFILPIRNAHTQSQGAAVFLGGGDPLRPSEMDTTYSEPDAANIIPPSNPRGSGVAEVDHSENVAIEVIRHSNSVDRRMEVADVEATSVRTWRIPPRNRSCENCQQRHYWCDIGSKLPNKCTNCEKYGDLYCVLPEQKRR